MHSNTILSNYNKVQIIYRKWGLQVDIYQFTKVTFVN